MARSARTADTPRKPDIYFVCGAGLGSSLACQMEAEEVLRQADLPASLHHDGISALPGIQADIIVSAENFRPMIDKHGPDPSITLVFLHNVVDKEEIRDRLVPVVTAFVTGLRDGHRDQDARTSPGSGPGAALPETSTSATSPSMTQEPQP
ncbi:PTS sugar transporter subunit IIB [Actinomyces sp. 2119]|uniref:PTS sugar transporter subunit IIB n=1 Tax=Actinomyces lilanjuaniae TaxID=2321394 RepID=A0ABN5PQD9_9ACTO|nr:MULTISPECIES: PTS sugar transporter subunit IIB [Actinomyces]AYD89047.1 PTS sugar transporter subunit IIB [Actinomyces lilanjuaniae]RJF40511.1 PTS sugar transporter subunit IIB [Actinomyces sp. 2119]RJF41828.1 PTS sugar transporter subunit IIB [Actinomyces sp. 2119]